MLLHAVLFQTLVAASAARSQYRIAPFDTQRSLSGNISLAHLGLDHLPSASIDSTVSTHLDRRAQNCRFGTTLCADGFHCADPGYFCCPDNMARGCPIGGTCCNAGESCAKAGNSCCGEYQCSSTEKCCGSSEGCAPTTATCCGGGKYCEDGKTCCKDSDGDMFCVPKGRSCSEYGTLVYDYKEFNSEYYEIFKNLCQGILQAVLSAQNNMLLTNIGRESDAGSQRRKNRREAGCTGAKKLGCTTIKGQNCEEFPFASTFEGGFLAAIICVEAGQNSALGSRFGNFVQRNAHLGRGSKFRVKIKNFNCKKELGLGYNKLAKRDTLILKSDGSTTYLSGQGYGNYSGGNVAITVPLQIDEDFQGRYTVQYTIRNGALRSGSVMDDEGSQYGNLTVTDSGSSGKLAFDVDQYGTGNLFLLAWAENVDTVIGVTTSLSASASTSLPASATGTSSPTPASKSDASTVSSSISSSSWRLVLVVVVLAALVQ